MTEGKIKQITVGAKPVIYNRFSSWAYDLGLSHSEFGEAILKLILSEFNRDGLRVVLQPHVRFHQSKARHGDRNAKGLFVAAEQEAKNRHR